MIGGEANTVFLKGASGRERQKKINGYPAKRPRQPFRIPPPTLQYGSDTSRPPFQLMTERPTNRPTDKYMKVDHRAVSRPKLVGLV